MTTTKTEIDISEAWAVISRAAYRCGLSHDEMTELLLAARKALVLPVERLLDLVLTDRSFQGQVLLWWHRTQAVPA